MLKMQFAKTCCLARLHQVFIAHTQHKTMRPRSMNQLAQTDQCSEDLNSI